MNLKRFLVIMANNFSAVRLLKLWTLCIYGVYGTGGGCWPCVNCAKVVANILMQPNVTVVNEVVDAIAVT